MSDTVQQVKERLSIVDVVGQYVKLIKAGKNYKALSPFKKEKTPSFYVSPDKGMYYDFSSGRGGDIFTFVQEMEGVDFRGALTTLAERAGVEIRHESKEVRSARDRLYEILEEACTYYETRLTENKKAINYLTTRGLEEATMRSFRLGFAPAEWQALNDHLVHKGYRTAELEAAGLVKCGDNGRYYDRFRSRIMFPIANSTGRVVAFSGRIFGEAAKDDKNAKYLNSPETELFDKSSILYGYNKAKQFIRKYDFSIIVEGQMDLVLSHQAGYTNTVAASGTGLTDIHLALLERLSKKLVMAFDADSAGIASSGRAAVLALARDMDVKVATVPLGKDPADCILEDKELWKKAVKESKYIVEFYFDVIEREETDLRKRELRMRDEVLPFIARMPSGVAQAHFVRMFADRTASVSEDYVWADVKACAKKLQKEEPNKPSHATKKNEQSKRTASTRKEQLERSLAGFLFWQEKLEPRVLEEPLLAKRAAELELKLDGLLARHQDERDVLSFQSEILHQNVREDPHTILDTLLTSLVREQLLEQRAEISREIRKTDRENDEKKGTKLLQQFKILSERIEELGPLETRS